MHTTEDEKEKDKGWKDIKATYEIGQRVQLTVVRQEDFGVFVDLGHGYLGLLEVIWLCTPRYRNRIPWQTYPAVGSKVDAWIIHIDDERHAVRLVQDNPQPSLSINFSLADDNTLSCKISSTGSHYELRLKWLFDMYGKLLVAATSVLIGANSVSIGCDEDPGELRWTINCDGPNSCTLSLLEFEGQRTFQPDSAGKPVFSTSCTRIEFAMAVLNCADTVLGLPGAHDIAPKLPRNGFPNEELALLKQCLSRYFLLGVHRTSHTVS